jgi:hypothetical protein
MVKPPWPAADVLTTNSSRFDAASPSCCQTDDLTTKGGKPASSTRSTPAFASSLAFDLAECVTINVLSTSPQSCG